MKNMLSVNIRKMNKTLKSIEINLLRIFVLINAFALLLAPFCLGQNLSVGGFHTQYVCKDSSAMSWGYQCDGRLGRGGPTYYPGYVNISVPIVKVAAGYYHSLYLDSNGKVWASGKSGNGQLGLGPSTINIWTPQQISNLDSIIDISAGSQHSLFLRYDGTVYACGRNDSRQLGDGSNVNRFTPVLVPGLSDIVKVSAGSDFSLFVRNDGSVYGAGSNGGGKMGLSFNVVSPPVKIDSLSNIIYASAGETHSLFVDMYGRAYFSGCNADGKAGIGSSVNYYFLPEHIYTVDSIIQVECKNDVSLFLRADSTVWICGRYTNALVTGGSNFNSLSIATQIPSLSGVTEIGVGESHYVFEIGDSVLYSMGDNHDGMLGDGSTLGSYSPVLVTNLCGAPLVLPPNTTSLDDNSINEIVIYPNPASNEIQIKVSNEKIGETYSLIDLFGKVVMTKAIDSTDFYIDTKGLTDGIYYFNIGSFKHKLLIQH